MNLSAIWSWLPLGKRLGRERPGQRQEGYRTGLLVLTAINMLNYADRYVPAAVKELIKEDLGLSDLETSYPATGMIFVYMIFAMIFGWVGDRKLVDRRYLLCGAILFWSLATALAGLAQNLEQLVILRSLVGIGEAAYATIAPPMISDFLPHKDRNIAFGIYYLAVPVGGALGFGIGAVLGGAFNWRVAFMGVGLPGVVAALWMLSVNDPAFGINDCHVSTIEEEEAAVAGAPGRELNELAVRKAEHSGGSAVSRIISEQDNDYAAVISPLAPTESFLGDADSDNTEAAPSNELLNRPAGPAATSADDPSERQSVSYHVDAAMRDFKQIIMNKYFLCSVIGSTANAFALGGLADWFPTFLVRYTDASISESGLVVGAATVIGGLLGTLVGSKTSIFFEKRIKNSYLMVPALYTIPATILLIVVINGTSDLGSAVAVLLIAEICVWTCLAPVSAISISCIEPSLRAKSCGLLILIQHVLGDMISPPIIGAISDGTGSLRQGLQLTWMFVAFSGVCWAVGAMLLPNFEIPSEFAEHLDHSKETTYRDLLWDPEPKIEEQLTATGDEEDRAASQSRLATPARGS